MMEFTLSRAIAMICGAILLAAAVTPFTDIMDDREDDRYRGLCEDVSEMIDAFADSGTDELVVSLDSILPSGTELELRGHIVKLRCEEKEYISTVKTDVSSTEIYINEDVVKMTKTGNGITVRKM